LKFWAVGGRAWVRGVCGVWWVSPGQSGGHRAKWWSQGKVVVTGQRAGHRAKGWSQGKTPQLTENERATVKS
jgi:hypothetical protein